MDMKAWNTEAQSRLVASVGSSSKIWWGRTCFSTADFFLRDGKLLCPSQKKTELVKVENMM